MTDRSRPQAVHAETRHHGPIRANRPTRDDRARGRRAEGGQSEQPVEDQDPFPGRPGREAMSPRQCDAPLDDPLRHNEAANPAVQDAGPPSGAHTAERPSPSPPKRSAAEVIGISGMFRRMLIGEMMWNFKATSGMAASQITVEATMPSTTHYPALLNCLSHAGSSRRSSSSSGVNGP